MFASDYPVLTHERCMSEAVNPQSRGVEEFAKFMSGTAKVLLLDD